MKMLTNMQVEEVNGGLVLVVLGAIAAGIAIADAGYQFYEGFKAGESGEQMPQCKA